MDKPSPHRRTMTAVQHRVQYIVTDKSACRERQAGWQTFLPNGRHHFPYRHRGKVGRRAIRHHRFIFRLISRIVGNSCLPQVDTHHLRCHTGTAAGLSHTEDHLGPQYLGRSQHRGGCSVKFRGNLQLRQHKIANPVRQQFHRFPRRIHCFAAERIKSGNQQFSFHKDFLRFLPLVCSIIRSRPFSVNDDSLLRF